MLSDGNDWSDGALLQFECHLRLSLAIADNRRSPPTVGLGISKCKVVARKEQ